jgi:hypothetical protein
VEGDDLCVLWLPSESQFYYRDFESSVYEYVIPHWPTRYYSTAYTATGGCFPEQVTVYMLPMGIPVDTSIVSEC